MKLAKQHEKKKALENKYSSKKDSVKVNAKAVKKLKDEIEKINAEWDSAIKDVWSHKNVYETTMLGEFRRLQADEEKRIVLFKEHLKMCHDHMDVPTRYGIRCRLVGNKLGLIDPRHDLEKFSSLYGPGQTLYLPDKNTGEYTATDTGDASQQGRRQTMDAGSGARITRNPTDRSGPNPGGSRMRSQTMDSPQAVRSRNTILHQPQKQSFSFDKAPAEDDIEAVILYDYAAANAGDVRPSLWIASRKP